MKNLQMHWLDNKQMSTSSLHIHCIIFIDKSLYSTWTHELRIIFLKQIVYINKMRPHKNIFGAMHTLVQEV